MKTFLILTIFITGCATLDDSLKLGAATGAIAGTAALYSTHSSTGRYATSKDLNEAALVGAGIGLITSYFIHKNLDENRNKAIGPDVYFGDLPPSPFIFPQSINQKGGR